MPKSHFWSTYYQQAQTLYSHNKNIVDRVIMKNIVELLQISKFILQNYNRKMQTRPNYIRNKLQTKLMKVGAGEVLIITRPC